MLHQTQHASSAPGSCQKAWMLKWSHPLQHALPGAYGTRMYSCSKAKARVRMLQRTAQLWQPELRINSFMDMLSCHALGMVVDVYARLACA